MSDKGFVENFSPTYTIPRGLPARHGNGNIRHQRGRNTYNVDTLHSPEGRDYLLMNLPDDQLIYIAEALPYRAPQLLQFGLFNK